VSLSPEGFSPASFRDPAGRIFHHEGIVKRLVTARGRPDYDRCLSTGLFERLWREGALVRHAEESELPDGSKVLIPDQLGYVSYPYEWCFGQLRDAALLTLEIAKTALSCKMILKDASAFNVQFQGSRPIFIDTLSFEPDDGAPWKAYGQFCRHFLAPLMLLSRVSLFFGPFWRHSIDGFPLDVASQLLPKSTYLRPGALIHIHLHARAINRYSDVRRDISKSRNSIGSDRKVAILDSLESTIRKIRTPASRTQWQDYYAQADHYSDRAELEKKAIVERVLDRVRPESATDLGGNVGEYARLVTKRGIRCVCMDMDPQCVERNYQRAKNEGDAFMLPLVMDITNPSASLGFAGQERLGLLDRPQFDLALALALNHHLRITGGIPLSNIADFFAEMAKWSLVEFVPKTDRMVQALLANREDVFDDYDYDTFLQSFGRRFVLEERFTIPDTDRSLCLFRLRNS
jgi:hypothetical protein